MGQRTTDRLLLPTRNLAPIALQEPAHTLKAMQCTVLHEPILKSFGPWAEIVPDLWEEKRTNAFGWRPAFRADDSDMICFNSSPLFPLIDTLGLRTPLSAPAAAAPPHFPKRRPQMWNEEWHKSSPRCSPCHTCHKCPPTRNNPEILNGLPSARMALFWSG